MRGALRKICRCWSRLQRNYYPSSGMIHWQVRWIYGCTLLSNKFKCYPFSLVQSNLVIRNFLVTLKLFLNTKCFLSLWSKLAFGHRKWFLNTNLFLIKMFLITKFDCINLIVTTIAFWKLSEWKVYLLKYKFSVHIQAMQWPAHHESTISLTKVSWK